MLFSTVSTTKLAKRSLVSLISSFVHPPGSYFRAYRRLQLDCCPAYEPFYSKNIGKISLIEKDEPDLTGANINHHVGTDSVFCPRTPPPRPGGAPRHDAPSVVPVVGDDVVCLFGRGHVIDIADDNKGCLVELKSWRLAQRSTVKCHLSMDSVEVVRKKSLYEMDAFEKVQFAQEEKQVATKHFQQKQYELALEHYDKAVTSVRYVQHNANSSNELRADLVVVLITCYNNAGTCCILIKEKMDDAIRYSTNALVLIDALYEKRGLKIHSILNKEGLSDVKLFGEWRAKSLLLKAKAYAEKGRYEEALLALKGTQQVIDTYPQEDSATLHKQAKDVKKLRAACLQQKKEIKKKEKQRAQAMFASPSKNKNHSQTNNKKVPVEETATTSVPKESTTPATTARESTAATAVLDTSKSDDKMVKEIPTKRSVSFSEDTKPGTEDIPWNEDADILPWYEEHKEALILTGAAGLALLAIVGLRPRK